MQICKERGARRVPYGGMIMKNIGKKLSALLLGVLLCATAALSAAAATGTVTLEDCDGLQFTLRDNMTAITRSSQPDDSYFTSNGLDYNEVMRAFEEGNIYLQATDNTKAMTLTLSYSESAASKRLGNYKDYDLAQLTEMKNNAIALSGGTYNSGTPDEVGDNMVWIFYNITAEGVHQYRAETVADGKNIALTLYRNGGDVQPDDYNILTDIVSTVKLTKRAAAAENNKKMMMIYIAAGAAGVALILLIVLIVVIKKAKKRKKQNNNDKILRELADKYQSRPNNSADDASGEPQTTGQTEAVGEAPSDDALADVDFDDEDDGYVTRRYSDADIARLLGDVEDDENFIDALSAAQIDPEDDPAMTDSATEEADAEPAPVEDAPEQPETEEAPEPAPVEDAPGQPEAEEMPEPAPVEDAPEQPETEEAPEPAPVDAAPEQPETEEAVEAAPVEDAPEQPETEEAVEAVPQAIRQPYAPIPDLPFAAQDVTADDLLEGIPEATPDEAFLESVLNEEEMPAEEPSPEEAEEAPAEEPTPEEAEETPAGEPTPEEAEETPAEEPAPEEAEETPAGEPIPEEAAEVSAEEPAPEEAEETPAGEPAPEEAAEAPAGEPAPEEAAETEESADGEVSGESDDGEETAEEQDEEFQEFVNDEVLARDESNQEKFKKSSDFFEEAPKKVMGVISSEEIEAAEEYDVIGEVEDRAEALEREPKSAGAVVKEVFGKIGGGFKYFFTHCGYFCINVKRAIKRRRIRKKRQKEAEARRLRQIEARRNEPRAVDARPRDKNGLVQVHRRDEPRER